MDVTREGSANAKEEASKEKKGAGRTEWGSQVNLQGYRGCIGGCSEGFSV
jgi:hypothetical protein